MKKFLNNRVLPFVCVFSIIISLMCGTASAAYDDNDSSPVATASVVSILDFLIGPIADFYSDLVSVLKGESVEEWGDNWAVIPRVVNQDNHHFYTEDVLYSICSDWNRVYQTQERYKGVRCDVAPFADTGYYCIRWFNAYGDTSIGPMVCLTEGDHGAILYDPSMDGGPTHPVVPGADPYNMWIPEKEFYAPYRLLDYEDLYNLAVYVKADVAHNDAYYYIFRDDGQLVYADSAGKPYAAVYKPEGYASQQDRPAVDDPDDEIDDDFNAKIDLENGNIVLPDGLNAFIDSVLYDEGNKTYYVDCFDEENNYYYFSFTYHINYTSITYIGTTEEYQKYEIAYELPDGRSSADLTAEDLEQLNLDVDVIPYVRSTDNTTVRSLYHFDGDTNDDSFWNYCTDFVWNDGASLTYMDVGVFEGALYLDENEHDFDFVLPSGMGSGDLTLQWRMYQSHTLAPQTDSYIKFGNVEVVYFDGKNIYNGGETVIDNYSTGVWNEFALIRNAGTIYYYINGLCVGSWANITAFDTIKFFFGDDQQTFKYFDELRVLNYALQEGGASYEPSAVPHDTNLALVLPDEAVPVADEYMQVNYTENYVGSIEFCNASKPENLTYGVLATSARIFPDWGYTKAESYMSYSDSFVTFSEGILFTRVATTGANYLENGTHTVALAMADGSVYTFTFDPKKESEAVFDWGRIFTYRERVDSSTGRFYLRIAPTTAIDLVAVEIVPGEVSTLSVELISSVIAMSPDQINTPTLAVKTDIDITSHQIGGVRPSVPEKGMVWAMVENQRITSLQIYNGQAWEGVDGRIWTGTRWIPASSYNIITLQDMYDIVDATPDFEYIYSESGFWAWWQKSWNAFTERLFAALGNGNGVSGGIPEDALPAVPDDETTEEDEGWTVWELLIVLRDGTWKVITGTVSTAFEGFTGFVSSVSNAGGFFEAYDSKNPDGVLADYGGEDLWTQ